MPSSPSNSTRTLVVILNHNLPEYTRKVHQQLAPFVNSTHDLLVLDNGSTGKGIYANADVRLEQNLFWGGALNWAFKYVLDRPEYDSLLFLNNDIELNGLGFVQELRRVLFEEDHAVISPCISGYAQPYTQMQNWGARESRLVRWLDYQAPLFHRKFIEEVRQFDEAIIHGWGQPTASMVVCEKKGWTTAVVDWVSIVHYGKAVTKKGKLRLPSKNKWLKKLGLHGKMNIIQFEKQAQKEWVEMFKDCEDFDIWFQYGRQYYYSARWGGYPRAPYLYRFHLINALIAKYGYRDYLEIGVNDGQCFKKIKAPNKTGVDPQCVYPVEFAMESDAFFAQLPAETLYDILFIDGYHRAEQVVRDIENGLKHLRPGGIILVHDCNPVIEAYQTETQTAWHWQGDVWKGWMHLRCTRPDLEMQVIDTDFGIGVVRPGTQTCYPSEHPYELTFQDLENDRYAMLNLVDVQAFVDEHKLSIPDFS